MSHPGSRRPQAVPPLCPRGLHAFKMVSEPLCSRVRCPPLRTQIKNHRSTDERMLQLFIWLTFFLNSKPLTHTFLLLIKRVILKWNIRRSVRVYNLPPFQIPSHLNTVPLKIQSLSLLIGLVVTGSTNGTISSFISRHYYYAFMDKKTLRLKG